MGESNRGYSHCYVARRACGCAVDLIASNSNPEWAKVIQPVIDDWGKHGYTVHLLTTDAARAAINAGKSCHHSALTANLAAPAQKTLPL